MTPTTHTPSITTVRTMQYLSHKHHADTITRALPHVHDAHARADLELARMTWNARAASLWLRMTLDELEEASTLYAAQWCMICGHEFGDDEDKRPYTRRSHVCMACWYAEADEGAA